MKISLKLDLFKSFEKQKEKSPAVKNNIKEGSL